MELSTFSSLHFLSHNSQIYISDCNVMDETCNLAGLLCCLLGVLKL